MNLRLTILVVIVLLLFGGAFLILRFTGSEPRPQQEPWMYHMDEGTISYISVAHDGQFAEFQRPPGSTTWYVLGDPDVPVFIRKWSGSALLLSGPRVNRVLAPSTDLAKYGLDPPGSVVTVSDVSGSTIEFHMGNPTPDGDNQYARLAQGADLFTVPEPWAKVVNRLALEPPYGRLYLIDDINVVRAIEVTSGDATATYFIDREAGWMLDGEPPAPVSDAFGEYIALLTGPRIHQLLARRIDDPEQFGLEPPLTRVVLARAGEVPIEFHLGDLTPDGQYRYARVLTTSDNSLYAISTSTIEWVDTLATNPPLAERNQDAEDGG